MPVDETFGDGTAVFPAQLPQVRALHRIPCTAAVGYVPTPSSGSNHSLVELPLPAKALRITVVEVPVTWPLGLGRKLSVVRGSPQSGCSGICRRSGEPAAWAMECKTLICMQCVRIVSYFVLVISSGVELPAHAWRSHMNVRLNQSGLQPRYDSDSTQGAGESPMVQGSIQPCDLLSNIRLQLRPSKIFFL